MRLRGNVTSNSEANNSVLTLTEGNPRHTFDGQDEIRTQTKDVQGTTETQASLRLQMLLYLNKYFYFVYILTVLVVSDNEETQGFNGKDTFPKILYIFVFAFEPCRLTMGYVGNLNERIAVLAGFGMVSLILIFPSVGFLAAASTTPMETIVNLVMAIFLLNEFVIAYRAANRMSKKESAHHHLLSLLGFHDFDDNTISETNI